MKIKKTYVADDGTAFENRDECENYEMQVKGRIFEMMIDKGYLKIWDYHGVEQKKAFYTPQWANGHPDSILSVIRYVKVLTEEAYEILQAHCEHFGQKCPPGVGNWIWIEDDRRCKYGWEDPAEYYEEAIRGIEFCRKVNLMSKAE